MRALFLMLIGLCVCAATSVVGQEPRTAGAPETFFAKGQAENSTGVSVSAPLQIHVERYTPDFDRNTVQEALRVGGYPGFLTALRKAPNVGYVEVAGRKVIIRWARESPSGTGRTIVAVTEKPVAFLFAGQADAKPRAGYEVALVQLKVDALGNGTGTMAAAARVKPGGDAGVQIDDYADAPVALSAVARR